MTGIESPMGPAKPNLAPVTSSTSSFDAKERSFTFKAFFNLASLTSISPLTSAA